MGTIGNNIKILIKFKMFWRKLSFYVILVIVRMCDMKELFFPVCIIEIIIQIFSIVKLKKMGDFKYWNLFIGINIASFVSNILAYNVFISNDALDLNDTILYLFICNFLFVSNLILSIIGLKVKKNLKNENIKLNKNSVFIGILIVLFNVIILIIIPILNNKTINNLVSNNIIIYLNDKYGDNNFEIINVKKDYSYNGIVQKYHTGYEVTVSSTLLEDNFIIYTSETNPQVIKDVSEEFIEKYYNKKINEYLSQKYDLEFDMWVKEENIPNTCGHIPTFNELVDYNAISDIFIIVKKNNNYNYDYNVNERINYLKKLSLDLINYLNISKDINIEFQRWANENSYSYDIRISGNTLKIIDKNDKIYEFDINNLKSEEQ